MDDNTTDDRNTFADPATAQRTRDVMERLMIRVLDQERPPYQYGTVQTINTDGVSCQVLLNGDTSAVKVAYGAMRPVAVGQVVRVSGNRGDRFISDVMGGAASADPISTNLTVPTGLTLGGTYRGILARWSPADGAYSYEIQFADNVGMSTNVRTYTTVSTQFSEEPLNAGQVVYARVRSKTSPAAGSSVSAWSAIAGPTSAVAMPVESVTDLVAPTTSPTAIVTSSLGFLTVEWLPVSNNDPLTYEVHLSTTNGFTPSGATTKIGETSGTFFTAERNAAGALLVYGTTYYVRIIAKDKDGAAAAGGQGSGVMGQVGSGDVSRIDYSKLGDGSPPASSPTPTVTNGVGYLYVTWTALSATADGVIYEIHVSTTSGFTPSGATYVGGTPNDFTFIRKTASGAVLTYGTLYYVKLIAKDVDGQAAASPQASGTPQQVVSGDLGPASVGNSQLAASVVTYDKTNLSIGGGNLLSNSNYESTDTFASTGISVYGGATVSQDTTTPWSGNNVAKIITSAVSQGLIHMALPSNATRDGTQVVCSVWLRCSTGTIAAAIAGRVLATAGAYLTEGGGYTAITITTTWQRFKTAPWSYSGADYRAGVQIVQSAGSVTFYADGAQVEIGNVATSYAPRPQEILPGTIGSTEIADNAITSPKIIAGAIVAGKIAAGVITANEIAASTITGDRIMAGTISAERLTIGTFGATLIPNGSFEDASASDSTLAAKWTRTYGASNTQAFMNSTGTHVRDGAKSFLLQAILTTGQAGAQSDLFPVDELKTYAHEMYWKANGVNIAGGVYYRIHYFDSTGLELSTLDIISNASAGSNNWNLMSGTHAAPAGTKQMAIEIILYHPDVTVTVSFDAIKVNEQINAVRIGNGVVTATKIAANTITAAQIAADTITANEIAANTVRAAEMVAGTITAASGIIANAAIDTAQIVNAAITTAKIGLLQVTTATIALAGVDTAQIKDAAILQAKIGSLEVTDAKIYTLAATKLTAGTISAQTIVLGSGGQFKVGSTPGAGTTGMYINDQGISIYNSSVRTIFLDATTGNATITGATIQSSTGTAKVMINSTDLSVIDSGGVTVFKVGTSQSYVLIPGGAAAGGLGYGFRLSGSAQYLGFTKGTPSLSDAIITMDLDETTPSIIMGSPTFVDRIEYNSRQFKMRGGTSFLGLRLLGLSQYSGDWDVYGAGIATRHSGNTCSIDWGYSPAQSLRFYIDSTAYGVTIEKTAGACKITYDDGTGAVAKTFVIDHPTDPSRYLVHACAEGRTVDVFYRGEGRLVNGEAWITLPDYFEALTHKSGRTVQITGIWDGLSGGAGLVASRIVNGTFQVRRIGTFGGGDQSFYWRVDAIRITAPMEVEPLKSNVQRVGDGPYTYLVTK